MDGDEQLTGRLKRMHDSKMLAEVTGHTRKGQHVHFAFQLEPGELKDGDKLQLLVSPERVIGMYVVSITRQAGTSLETVDARITNEETYDS